MSVKQGWIKVAVACIALMTAASGQAYVLVDWTTAWPVMQMGKGDIADWPTYIVPIGSLCQLIWSRDDFAGAIYDTATPTGDDVLLATAQTDKDGYGGNVSQIEAKSYPGKITDNADLVSGMMYVRVWDSPSPALGAHYVQGSLANGGMDVSLKDSPVGPPFDEARIGGFSVEPILFPVDQTLTAIPEPGTFALFGIGAAVLALRKRCRR